MALRQRVWIDNGVQGVLVGRVILYWICGVLYVGVGSACFQYYQNPDLTLAEHITTLFHQIWPWLPTAVLVLPLAIYDVVRMSNMFAGPIYRLRRHFQSLRQDMGCAPLGFREDDYWRDLPSMVNDMQAEVLSLRNLVQELQARSTRDAQQIAALQSDGELAAAAPAMTEAEVIAAQTTSLDSVSPLDPPGIPALLDDIPAVPETTPI